MAKLVKKYNILSEYRIRQYAKERYGRSISKSFIMAMEDRIKGFIDDGVTRCMNAKKKVVTVKHL